LRKGELDLVVFAGLAFVYRKACPDLFLAERFFYATYVVIDPGVILYNPESDRYFYLSGFCYSILYEICSLRLFYGVMV